MRIAALLIALPHGSPGPFDPVAGKPAIRHAAERLQDGLAERLVAGLAERLQAGLAERLEDGLAERLPGQPSPLLPVGEAAAIAAALTGLAHLPPVAGGADWNDSLQQGLEALAARPDPPDMVLVHDAARPWFPTATIPSLIAALATAEGAIPVLPVTETLRTCRDGLLGPAVAHAGLIRSQTPQGFRLAPLLASLRGTAPPPAAVPVAGSAENIPIRTQEDIMQLERLLTPPLLPRVGTGFDVHAMAEGRPMVLCGITVPHPRGLAGHSDADVGIHALCDAIYGALAEGDIGRHFPPSEAAWKDADSARFLRHAAARIAARGGVLAHADVTLICETPKITPHAPAMRARLAELLGVEIGRVSVKATTTERLGFTGRGEGIAAQAVATVLMAE